MTSEPNDKEFKTLEPEHDIKVASRSFPSYIILNRLNFGHLNSLIYKMGLTKQRMYKVLGSISCITETRTARVVTVATEFFGCLGD